VGPYQRLTPVGLWFVPTNHKEGEMKSNHATLSEVRAVPEPEFTKTWRPIGHAKVLDALTAATRNLGIGIKSETYSLSKTGGCVFGSWVLDIGNHESDYSLGFRNSVDKSFALGICAGTHIMVCSNMCFSGTFIEFHKHTSGLSEDRLLRITKQALGGAVIEMERMDKWQKTLHEVYVPKHDFKELAYDFATQGVFSPSNLSKYITHVDEEIADSWHRKKGRVLDGARTLHAVHGGATRLMRGWNLLRSSEATKSLNSICDDYLVRKAA
jgi:hypothetical protein